MYTFFAARLCYCSSVYRPSVRLSLVRQIMWTLSRAAVSIHPKIIPHCAPMLGFISKLKCQASGLWKGRENKTAVRPMLSFLWCVNTAMLTRDTAILSVRSSVSDTVLKRLNISSNFLQNGNVNPISLIFAVLNILKPWNSDGVIPTRRCIITIIIITKTMYMEQSGTVSLMTLHRLHRCRFSERNWKLTYCSNLIRTLFCSLQWFSVAIVVLEVICYLGHVKKM